MMIGHDESAVNTKLNGCCLRASVVGGGGGG